MSAAQAGRIGDLFVNKGLVSDEQIAEALRTQAATGQRLGEVLVARGLISRMDVASALQLQWSSKRATPTGIAVEVAESRSYRDTEERLRARLAAQEARIEELSRTVNVLEAAVADRDERLAVILTFLQAPASR
jgi:uncharacterized coiled-coil protein SlyX